MLNVKMLLLVSTSVSRHILGGGDTSHGQMFWKHVNGVGLCFFLDNENAIITVEFSQDNQNWCIVILFAYLGAINKTTSLNYKL